MTQSKLDPQRIALSHTDTDSTLPSSSMSGNADLSNSLLRHRPTIKAIQPKLESVQVRHPKVPAPLKAPQRAPKNSSIKPLSNFVKPMDRGLKLAKTFLWGSLLGITALVSGTIGATLVLVLPISLAQLTPPAKPQINLGDKPRSLLDRWQNRLPYHVSRPVNILVMGIDQVPEAQADSKAIFAGRSDTMLLVHVDPTNKTLSILSIPRDTQIDLTKVDLANLDSEATEVPDYGAMKVNQANALGGPAMANKVVSKTLNDVQIDRYVRINTEAFRELVDLLGGLEVFVPAPMKYTDHTQKLYIDLKPGLQTLNGDQAEQFARFRYDSYGDIGRVQRQQTLLKALRERLKNPTVITKLPQALKVMTKYIDTNLSLEEMIALVNFGLDLESGSFKMVMLPGRFSAPNEYVASYWLLDSDGRNRVMQQYFSIQPTLAYADPTTNLASSSSISHLRIAVQNASGQPNASGRIAESLRNQGFTNVYIVEDWPEPQSSSRIIAQRGDEAAANTLNQALGFGNVELDSTGDIESDLTIRLGNDLAQ